MSANPEDYAPPGVRETHHQTQVPQMPEFDEGYVAPPRAEVKPRSAYQAGDISEQAIAVQFELSLRTVKQWGWS